MQFWNFFKKININDTIIKSIIFNTIIEIFLNEKKIDIKKYLISIKINKNFILIKTNKPIITSELLLLNEKIINLLNKKFERLNFDISKYEIKYK